MQCFGFNYFQLLSSRHHSVFLETNINRRSFLCSNPADIGTKLGTLINQVDVSGKSIIYVRSGDEFRSFNSSVTFVFGLGRTRLYKRILEKSLLSFSFFLSPRYLIQRKVSQSKLPELFMTSVPRYNSPSSKRESYIYFYIITTLVIYPLTTYASLF